MAARGREAPVGRVQPEASFPQQRSEGARLDKPYLKGCNMRLGLSQQGLRRARRPTAQTNEVSHGWRPKLFPSVGTTPAERAAHRDGAAVHDGRHREAV